MSDQVPVKSGETRNNGRWQKGQSGNPRGRPRNSRSQLAAQLDGAAEQDAPAVYAAIKESAIKGDTAAQGMLMARWWPAVKRTYADVPDLPAVETAEDIGRACAHIVARVANGEMTIEEGGALSELLERLQKSLVAVELEKRLADLEALIRERKPGT